MYFHILLIFLKKTSFWELILLSNIMLLRFNSCDFMIYFISLLYSFHFLFDEHWVVPNTLLWWLKWTWMLLSSIKCKGLTRMHPEEQKYLLVKETLDHFSRNKKKLCSEVLTAFSTFAYLSLSHCIVRLITLVVNDIMMLFSVCSTPTWKYSPCQLYSFL